MAWTLSANWEAELLRAQLIARLGPEKAAELEPDTSDLEPYIIPPGVDFAAIGNSASLRAEAAESSADPLPGRVWAATIGCFGLVYHNGQTTARQ